jgi:hypothetical protein
MTPETTIVGLLVTAIGAVFALYQRGVASQIQTIKDSCAAKDLEIAWQRKQNESWTAIAQDQVRINEKLAAEHGK